MWQWARRRAKHPAEGSQPPPIRPGVQPEAEAVGETVPPARMRGEEREGLREAAAQVARHRVGGVLAPPNPEPEANSHGQEPPLRPPAISVPVVLPGSCRPIPGLASAPQTAAAATADTALPLNLTADGRPPLLLRPGGGRRGLMRHRNQQLRHSAPGAGSPSGRILFLLALLQIVVGSSIVLLILGVMFLSSNSQLKITSPLWASCLAILCGIFGIVILKKPLMVLANLLILLSVVSVLLNLTGFILGHQAIQFVSNVHSCDLNLLFAVCALSAFTALISFSVAVLRYLQMLTARRLHLFQAQTEAQDHTSDPENFTLAVPPPYYVSTFLPRNPPLTCRASDISTTESVDQVRGQIGSDDVFYEESSSLNEAAESQNRSEQEDAVQGGVSKVFNLWKGNDSSQGTESSSRVSLSASSATLVPAGVGRRRYRLLKKWSESDPVLHCQLLQGEMLRFESKNYNEANAPLCAVAQQSSLRGRALRERPQSLMDLTATERPEMWITDQSSIMSSDVCGLADNTYVKVARSDTFLKQGMPPSQKFMQLDAPVLP